MLMLKLRRDLLRWWRFVEDEEIEVEEEEKILLLLMLLFISFSLVCLFPSFLLLSS